MRGIDISKYQGNVDFSKVKAAGIEVVIIKATEGTSYVNPYMNSQYDNARANGMKIGFYHFLNKSDAVAQAKYFLNAISDKTSDCKLVIDVENVEGRIIWNISDASSITRAFADYLISQGKEPMIYTGDYFYKDTLNSSVKDIPLWVANYGSRVMASNYIGHQYTEKGTISGLSGYFDMNNFSEGILLNKEGEEEMLKGIISVGSYKDLGPALKLHEYYKYPIQLAEVPYDYSKFENVICIGATPSNGWTTYKTQLIQGTDGYDTDLLVLKSIGKV